MSKMEKEDVITLTLAGKAVEIKIKSGDEIYTINFEKEEDDNLYFQSETWFQLVVTAPDKSGAFFIKKPLAKREKVW